MEEWGSCPRSLLHLSFSPGSLQSSTHCKRNFLALCSQRQHRPWTSAWFLATARAMNINMASGGSANSGIPPWPSVVTWAMDINTSFGKHNIFKVSFVHSNILVILLRSVFCLTNILWIKFSENLCVIYLSFIVERNILPSNVNVDLAVLKIL